MPYEPEYDRYGGRRGVEIAERHFSVASRVALKLVRQSRDNPPKRAGFAYRLMVIAASGFGLPEEAIGPFFASYARHALDGCSLPERGRRGAEAELENSFRGRESRLAHERKVLASWLQGGSGACEDEDDLRTWQSSLLASRRELEALQRDGELTVTSGRGGDGERWADDSLALHSILASYIHMTNNRLGLRLLEEAHLAYLASRAFGKSERA